MRQTMKTMRRRDFVKAAAVGALVAPAAPARTIVVGDVHGDLEQFSKVLRMAGVVDDGMKWAAGRDTLVQIGDVVDRGVQCREVIDLLVQLEREARKSRGRVSCIIGNHEAMRMYGDLRYVAAAEYEAFRTGNSEKTRDKFYQATLDRLRAAGEVKTRPDLTPGFRQKWDAEHPLGQFELVQAFAPEGKYGKWALDQDVVLKLDDTLFVHAGISPRYVDWPIRRFNDAVKEELRVGVPPGGASIAQDQEGPLWWRGFALNEEESLREHVEGLLSRHGVKRIIVGHTPTQGRGVVSRLGGKIILADVGLSKTYGSRTACVVIEEGQAYALDEGKKLKLE